MISQLIFAKSLYIKAISLCPFLNTKTLLIVTSCCDLGEELGFQILGNKMSNKLLSNASPPPERVEAQPQDHIPPPMSSMGDLREFMDPFNFDPINNRPLLDGNSEWSVVGATPGFDSQPPHYSGESPRSQNGGSRPSGTTGDNACIHKDGDLVGARGSVTRHLNTLSLPVMFPFSVFISLTHSLPGLHVCYYFSWHGHT